MVGHLRARRRPLLRRDRAEPARRAHAHEVRHARARARRRAAALQPPLVDAIGWGLALEEANRPRTIGQWRDVLFGQRGANNTGAMQAAKPQAIPTLQKPGSGVPAGGTAARSPNADQAQRAAAIAAVIAETRRETRRETSPWRWIFMAAIVLGVAIIGSRMVFHREHKATAQQPTVVILPTRVVKLQRPEQPPAPAAQPAAPADTTGPAGDSTASPTQPAVDTTAATVDTPAASPTLAAPVSQRVEQRIEVKMHAADPNGLGLTREEFAQTFPRLSEHFDEARHRSRRTYHSAGAHARMGALLGEERTGRAVAVHFHCRVIDGVLAVGVDGQVPFAKAGALNQKSSPWCSSRCALACCAGSPAPVLSTQPMRGVWPAGTTAGLLAGCLGAHRGR